MRWIMRLIICSLLLASLAQAGAQDPTALQVSYEKKLKKEFATKITWERSLEAALARGEKEGKPIFAYFTRSFAP